MGKMKISPTFEEGTCSVCRQNLDVREITDESAGKVAKVCKECAKKVSNLSTMEFVKKYGKAAAQPPVQAAVQTTVKPSVQTQVQPKSLFIREKPGEEPSGTAEAPERKAEQKEDVLNKAKEGFKGFLGGFKMDFLGKKEAAEKKEEPKKEEKPEAKAEAKPEGKPEVKAEARPEAKAEAKPETKAEAKPQEISKLKEEMLREGRLETSVDDFFRLVKEKEKLTIPDAAKMIETDEDIVEEWANILSKAGMVELVYPSNLLDKPYVRFVPKKEE